MAGESYQPLVTLGQFKGLDFTSAPDTPEGAGYGIMSSNANPTRIHGALLPERGRVNMANFSSFLYEVDFVGIVVGNNDIPLYLIQGNNKRGAPYTVVYNPDNGVITQYAGAVPFDEIVQYGGVVYTNGGQRLFLQNYPPTYGSTPAQFYTWQYTAQSAAGLLTLGASTGSMAAGTYFYVVTQTTTMPDGSISETSVDLTQYANPPQIVLASTGGVIVTPTSPLTFVGTNSDGTSYTTNLYRQSSNQPGYFLVTNLTLNNPYHDTAADTAIVGNQQLTVHRDPPPVGQANMGTLGIHKNRVWCFVTVDNADTDNLPQVQLWYSNVDRPWEFDDTSQVLLLQSDVTAIPDPVAGPNYGSLYGNEPKRIGEVGTILCALKKREFWAVYGDDASSFVQRELFKIGAVSKWAVTFAIGGVFWLSENGGGPYWFDGSTPTYKGERIRGWLRPLPMTPGTPASAGIAPYDQSQATSCFSNLTWYLCFPTLNQSIGYHTVSGEWTSILPYAPPNPAAIAYEVANPNSFGGIEMNEVVAARKELSGQVDWWFADTNLDLGKPQTFSWTCDLEDKPGENFEKWYRYLTLTGPIQPGSAVVTITVDPGMMPAKSFTWTIPDLTTTTRQITGIRNTGTSGGLRGFMAQITVTVTGVAGQPAPQIWGVTAWGSVPPDRNLVLPA